MPPFLSGSPALLYQERAAPNILNNEKMFTVF
jgi:hypothetical protein